MDAEKILPITKMSGSGNDFILTDNRNQQIPERKMVGLARALCRRRVSVGADGMIFIQPSDRYDFRWRFFNADGSEAEMCGNGGRCAARFAALSGIAGPTMTFDTLAGPIQAWVAGDQVKLQMTEPRDYRPALKVEVEGRPLTLDFINTGVPHVVLVVDDLEAVDVRGLGRIIRFHPAFQPAGANVNFLQKVRPGELSLRTYERGVEDETLACGTGSVAAAAVIYLQGLSESPIQVHTRGGEVLTVYFDGIPGQRIERVFFEGRVRLVFQGEVFTEALTGLEEGF